MIEKTECFPLHSLTLTKPNILNENMLLFDIETTGLSAARSQIYCIGCGYISDDTYTITLFFAERPEEEPEIIQAFLELLKTHSTIVTFNGTTFDIPFVKKRYPEAEAYLNGCDSLDLFTEAKHLRQLLQLSSYKQKSLELFLGLLREDLYDGGQLIQIYQDYVKHPEEEALGLLLLHNFEDVAGMFQLMDILSFFQLKNGEFEITSTYLESSPQEETIYIQLKPFFPLPQQVTYMDDSVAIWIKPEEIRLRFPLHQGELKHFFPNPADYYYLPDEDTAIHKSVGEFVDASHRKKATKKNCYIRKTCQYICIPTRSCNCYLKKEYNEKNTYLEYPFTDMESLHSFLQTMFQCLIK